MTMTKLLLAPLAALALLSAACDKAPTKDAPIHNELRAPGMPAPVGRGGTADDGVKPVAPGVKPIAPIAPVAPVGKGGVPDDSVKPATLGKGGVPDDSVKPAGPVKRP